MDALPRGGNTALPDPRPDLVVAGAAQGSVDLLVLQLGPDRRVRSDADLVFFNQPVSPEGAVRLTAPDAVSVDLAAVPDDITTLAVAVALDDSVPGSLAAVAGLAVRVGPDISAQATDLTTERAAVLVELYRRDTQWKVRNVSAGWDAGLAALVGEHGVTVDDDAPAAPPPAPEPVPAPEPPAQGGDGKIDLGKRSGRIDMVKGQRVCIEKSELVVAAIEWPPDTDYDVFALIRYTDGHDETVSTFGTEDDARYAKESADGAVRHLGDVGRANRRLSRKERKELKAAGGDENTKAVERIEIRPHAGIAAVVPVAYSAQSNGTGSFRRYRVSMSIDNGVGTTVSIDAANADDDDTVFSCVPGIIRITDAGVVIESLEQYSEPGSEARPTIGPDLTVRMDTGPVNDFK